MRTVGYWAGACYELLALPFREGPGMGCWWLLVAVVEIWIILEMLR